MKEYQEFCLTLIQQHFGELGYAIAQALIRRNGQTIPEIMQMTSIDPERIILGLTTMMRFDVIRCSVQRTVPKPQLKDVTAAKKAKIRRARTTRRAATDDDLESEDEELFAGDDDTNEGYAGIEAVSYGTNMFGLNEDNFLTPNAALANSRRISIPHPVLTRRPPGTMPDNAVPVHPNSLNAKRFAYYLDLNLVRGFSRFPRYLTMMHHAYGDEGLAVMQEFVTRGKLTLEQAVAASVCNLELKEQKQREKAAERAASGAGSPSETKDDAMLNSGSLADLVDNFATTQERVVSVLHAMLKERYLIYSNGHFDDTLNAPQSKPRRRKTNLVADDDADDDEGKFSVSSSSSNSTRMSKAFVINHERFSYDLRADLIQAYVARRVSPAAGVVVRSLLNDFAVVSRGPSGNNTDPNAPAASAITSQSGTKVPYLSRAEIAAAVTRYAGAAAASHAHAFSGHSPQSIAAIGAPPTQLDTNEINELLEDLSDSNIGLMHSRTNRNTGTLEYAFLPERALQQIRLEQVQALVKERCGPHAARIFRLLSERIRLEEKQVSDFALLPRKETKCALYSMFESQFVELQEVPRTSERHPSKAFFLWSLPHERLCNTVLRCLYSSYRNAQLRMTAETTAVQSVLDKNAAGLELSEEESKLGSLWAQAFTRLESAVRGHAMLIFLFRDLTL